MTITHYLNILSHYVSIFRVFDCRTVGQHKKWNVGSSCELERVTWDHFHPHRLLASTDKGQVVCVDLRWVIIIIIDHNCQATGTGTGTWDLRLGKWEMGPGKWE